MASDSSSTPPTSEDCDAEAHEFLRQLNLDSLCKIASAKRHGVPCTPGGNIIGEHNVVQELAFKDGTVWLARIPRPDACFQLDESTLSYAAVLRYLKKHTDIPVPTVFGYAAASDPGNTLGVGYILMEKLPGRKMPSLDSDEHGDQDYTPPPKHVHWARKVHQQLTDITIDLARHPFPKIGALRETASGTFNVVDFFHEYTTAGVGDRATVFAGLEKRYRGPYASVSDFYAAMVKFNIELVTRFPEEYGTSTEWEAWPEAIADYNALGELAAAVVVPEFDKGPFFIFHNQLEMNNILVDDEFNITGILDFTGTVGPLPTLCNFPWLFHMGIDGPLFSRRDYIKVFTTRVATNKTAQPPSALGPPEVRRHLIQQALDRRSYEQDIFNLWIVEHVPSLYFDNLGKEYRQKVDPEADAEMWARVRRGSKKRKEFQKKLMDGELVGPCPSCRENPLPEAGDSSA